MSTAPTFLITAASGHIGEELIPILLQHSRKPTVVLPTGNGERLTSKVPKDHDPSRVHVVAGDIGDSNFVQQLCSNYSVTGVFVCLTTEGQLPVTLNFFDALRHSPSVKHLVYLSACGDYSLSAIQDGALLTENAGHIVVKYILEAKLRHGLPPPSKGGMTWTIIGPSLFFINDLRSKKSILEKGLFDEPIGGRGVSRVHPADIALAVSKALFDGGERYHGKKIMIGSQKNYTNEDTAKLWSVKLGRKVTVAGSDEKSLAEFEAHFTKRTNPVWGRDMRLMYETFEQVGFSMSGVEYEEQVEFLGKEPESYEKWVQEVAVEWKKEL